MYKFINNNIKKIIFRRVNIKYVINGISSFLSDYIHKPILAINMVQLWAVKRYYRWEICVGVRDFLFLYLVKGQVLKIAGIQL